MDRKLFFKLLAIGFMSLLLLVPLALIEDQIRQRSARQDDVQRSIAAGAARTSSGARRVRSDHSAMCEPML